MKHHTKNPKVLNRTKTIAATIAALGTAIGVNMGDVLAGTSEMQNTGSRQSSIAGQPIKKPDVRSPKVERAIKNRPSTFSNKSTRPALKSRPNVRADKSSRTLREQPGVISDKLGK